MTERDRKMLVLLAIAVAVWLPIYFWPSSEEQAVVGGIQNLDLMEKRVAKQRRVAASVPAQEEILKKVQDELNKREKGLIQAETAAQAQAQLLQIVRRVGSAQQPALTFKGTEFGPPRLFNTAYGEVVMTISMDAGIEQVVNFLADISNQPELISVSDLTFTQVTNKQKLVPVRLTFTGLVPKKLIPEKKGGAAF